MTLIIPPGFANVRLLYRSDRFDSGAAVTVFGIGRVEDAPSPDLQLAADAIYDSTVDSLVPRWDNNMTFVGVEVDSATVSASHIEPVVGGASQRSVPVNSALLVKKITPRRGRRAQGRMFLPLIIDGDQVEENGVIVDVIVGQLQLVIDSWFADWQIELGTPMVILQNSEGISAPLSPPPVVESLEVDPKIATQRRRLRR